MVPRFVLTELESVVTIESMVAGTVDCLFSRLSKAAGRAEMLLAKLNATINEENFMMIWVYSRLRVVVWIL